MNVGISVAPGNRVFARVCARRGYDVCPHTHIRSHTDPSRMKIDQTRSITNTEANIRMCHIGGQLTLDPQINFFLVNSNDVTRRKSERSPIRDASLALNHVPRGINSEYAFRTTSDFVFR